MPNHLDEIKQRSLEIAEECDRQIRAIEEEIEAASEEDVEPMRDPQGTLISLDALERLERDLPDVYTAPTEPVLEARRWLRARAMAALPNLSDPSTFRPWMTLAGRSFGKSRTGIGAVEIPAVPAPEPRPTYPTAWDRILEDDEL